MITLPHSEQSFWREAYPSHALYPTLTEQLETDVVVVGGGITGLTTAYLLKQSGLQVVVLEKHTIGGGTTGRSTGKVTSQHGIFYTDLVERMGPTTALAYATANQAAVKQVHDIIEKEHIACDWQWNSNYVFTTDAQKVAQFKQEAEVSAALDLPASFETTTPLPFDVAGAVKFDGQGKMSAQKYVMGLAKVVNGNGSHVFEQSTAIGMRDGSSVRVRTRKGGVTAKHIVIASSVPTLPLIARASYGLLEAPSETYAVAGRLEHDLPDMYISPDNNHYSILPITIEGTRTLLIVGESHFWGLRTHRQGRFERLAQYAEKHFGVTAFTHHWSDRDYTPYDGIPLVGKLYPWSRNVYVGTGFKKWGLSNGTAAGMILRDLITGTPNPWADAFRATRTSPITSIPRLVARIAQNGKDDQPRRQEVKW